MTLKPMVQAALGEKTARTPVWMMRQAGRYLPEYHELKDKAGGFLGLCKIPEHGIEAALQPIRRFGFDGAILFSDILIPAEAMGIELAFDPGPVIGNPVRAEADVKRLRVPDPEESMPFVLDILRGLSAELPEETALIGFAGAPFTVASYMVSKRAGADRFEVMRKMLYDAPDLAASLIDKLVETTASYLNAQIDAGAEIIQLFDSSAWLLTHLHYHSFALEPARRVIERVARPGVPVIYFAPGAMVHLEWMGKTGADVVGVDWRIALDRARQILGNGVAVQGNLDPACLLGNPAAVKEAVRSILSANDGRPGHIFNLGHGVLKDTPVENVEAMVTAVREGV